jgi:predicted nucleotidyltransferase/predicted RNase H-like HicB family nuclease
MRFEIEIDREAGNGRWIAEVPELPGCLVHGASEAEVRLKAQALALRVLADRLEHGESVAELVDIAFTSRRHPSLGSNGTASPGQPGEAPVSCLAPEQALERLRVSPSDLQQACEEFQVAELSLFGSALRADFRLDSDVDLLVVFLPDVRVGFLHLARLQRRLGELFARRVDLVPKLGLKPLVAENVLPVARVLYAAGRPVPPGHPPSG